MLFSESSFSVSRYAVPYFIEYLHLALRLSICTGDGVSEGQLNTVLEAEIPAIKAACRDINPNYNPKLTYVVCAKRHHFRFFAERESDTDRTGNLRVFDFYLAPSDELTRFIKHPGCASTPRWSTQ